MNTQKVRDLARKISDHRIAKSTGTAPSAVAESLNLGDIEDHCLKFLQHNVKLFVFGQIHRCLGAFEQQVNQNSELKQQQDLKDEADEIDDQIVISRPTAILFPRFTYPIISIACGAAHALAISIDNKIYSWGSGSYGALGYGFREDVPKPRQLEMIDHRGIPYIITQIACGKFHSICLTRRKAIFTWGKGAHGRLGHGNEEDQLVPKDIKGLSQRKPIFIAAGESHSAAITEKRQLFTWGNGGFGRLGLGQDSKETTPVMVEELDGQEIDYVSLGFSHSLAVTTQGDIYSWGQNKYGKLGLQPHQVAEGSTVISPETITMNRFTRSEKLETDEERVVQLSAGTNHSMAISESGRCFSWGYAGKGVLGRSNLNYSILPCQIGAGSSSKRETSYTMKIGLSGFIQKYLKEQMKSLKGSSQQNEGNSHTNAYFVQQVRCSSNNTYALSNTGDIYVIGDNTFCQHGIEDIYSKPPIIDIEEGNEIWNQPNISQIKIPQMSSLDKVSYIECGGSHIFAKTELDEIYGWGKNDEGQLGIGYLTEKIIQPTLISALSFKGVKQISCSDNYSAGLSIYGEVYVAGAFDGGKLGMGKGLKRGYQLEFTQIPGIPELETISCGMSHMVGVSRYSNNPEMQKQLRQTGKAWAWGKNNKGQLGIGSNQSKFSPTIIENAFERFKKVACGINFTLGLSITNKVYFWGNRKYNCDPFVTKDIEEPILLKGLDNENVVDIAVDTKYCLVLLEKGEIRQWGKYLLDKKVDAANFDIDALRNPQKKQKGKVMKTELIQKFPQSKNFSVFMKQVVTSQNHSCAISANDKVYVWGHNNEINRLGLSCQQASENAEIQPEVLSFLDLGIQKQKETNHAQEERKKISNTIKSKDKKQDTSKPSDLTTRRGDDTIRDPTKRRQTGAAKIEKHMEEAHACEIIELGDVELVHDDHMIQQDIKGKLKETVREKQHELEQMVSPNQDPDKQMPTQTERTIAPGADLDDSIEEEVRDFTQILIEQIDEFNKDQNMTTNWKRAKGTELSVLHTRVDLFVLEYIRQELRGIKESPMLVDISKINQNTTIIDANIILQKILSLEDVQSTGESHISQNSLNLKKAIEKILIQVLEFSKYHQQNKDVLSKAKQSFSNRIVEMPFDIDAADSHTLMTKGLNDNYALNKKVIQKIMLHIQMHPCYVVKILKSGILDFHQQKMFIKQMYKATKKSETERLNYLLISVFEQMLKHEIDPVKHSNFLEEEIPESFNSPENQSISAYIFRRVFKSQQTNNETVCCIIAHMANSCLNQFSKSSGNQMDSSLDVKNEVQETSKGKPAATSGGKPQISQSDKALMLGKFLQENLDQVLKNQILRDQSMYFGHKQKTAQQLEYLTKQFKDYQDKKLEGRNELDGKIEILPEDSLGGVQPQKIKELFPVFRFSSEIVLMIDIVEKHLCQFHHATEKDEKIASQILGLCFANQTQKIWDNNALFLFPYLLKPKLMQHVSDQFTKVHAVNMRNIIHVFICFLTGAQAFPDENEQGWCKDLTSKLQQIETQFKLQIMEKIHKYGRRINNVVSYKNFENQIRHSLESEESSVIISQKLIGQLISGISKNEKLISLQTTVSQDPLIKLIKSLNEPTKNQIEALANTNDYGELVTLKLKTRLFVSLGFEKCGAKQKQEILSKYVRCFTCNGILLEEMAVSNYDDNLVMDDYEPQDKEGIMSIYCKILNKIDPIDKDLLGSTGAEDNDEGHKEKKKQGITELIEMAEINAKKTGQNMLGDMIQTFMKKFNGEVVLLTNKLAAKQGATEEKKPSYLQFEPEDLVTIEILKEAEAKIHERVNQKFYISLIEKETERYLLPEIKAKMESFKKQQIKRTQELYKNYQFGLANQEFIHLIDWGVEYKSALDTMAKVKRFTTSQAKSPALSSAMGKNMNIRGYLSLDVPSLLKNGTIAKVNIKELENLLPHCQLVLIESSEGQSIELKLVFKQVKKVMCGPDKVLQEQIMMKFDIYPKKLKEMRQQIAKDMALAKSNKKEPSQFGLIEGQKEQTPEMANLKFEENDSLEFDPDKFFALIARMERQKAAYAMSEDDVATAALKQAKRQKNQAQEQAEKLADVGGDALKGAQQLGDIALKEVEGGIDAITDR